MIARNALLTVALATAAFAQGRGGPAAETHGFFRYNYGVDEALQPIDYPKEPIATQHEIKLHGETIAYTARVGFIPIQHATTRAVEGHLFYVYYAKNGVQDKSKRPVWFVFKQRGAATIWLHMGAYGPKVVKLNPDGSAPPPPYTYVDNPYCLLDTGDLVFIDAMGTGYSRPVRPSLGPNFGGVVNDIAAFGEFVRSFFNQYELWGQPILIAGESYGTTRGAGLAGYLTDRSMPVNGVHLLSAVFATGANAGEQRQLATLPTEIMTAHYHKRLAPDLQKLSVEQIARQAGNSPAAVPRIPVRRRARHAGPAREGPDHYGAVHRPVEAVHRFARPAGSARPVQHGVAARPSPDDVPPRLPVHGLSDRRRGERHELRLQQFEHHELLPGRI
jgi:hypothetical protein